MASLRRKPSGLYYLIWTDSKRVPSQVSESLKTEDRGRAQGLKTTLEYEYLEGRHDPWHTKWFDRHIERDASTGLAEMVERYIYMKRSSAGARSWNDRSAANKGYVLRMFAEHAGARKPVKHIDTDDLRAFYNRPEITSDHTRIGYRRTVIALLNWLLDEGYLSKVPQCHVDAPQLDVPEFLTMDQMAELYAWKEQDVARGIAKGFTKGPDQRWMIDAWKLAVSTGLRKSEIMNLRTGSVDLEGELLLVGYQHKTKSMKQRKLPFLFEAADVLKRYCSSAARNEDQQLAKTDYLFGRKGSTMAGRLSKEFTRGARTLWPARSELTLHSLRHTFAVRYLTAPATGDSMDFRMYKLQRLMGHASRDTTDQYLKAIPYDLKI